MRTTIPELFYIIFKKYPNIIKHIFLQHNHYLASLFINQKIDRIIVYERQIMYQLINRLGWKKKLIKYQKSNRNSKRTLE